MASLTEWAECCFGDVVDGVGDQGAEDEDDSIDCVAHLGDNPKYSFDIKIGIHIIYIMNE